MNVNRPNLVKLAITKIPLLAKLSASEQEKVMQHIHLKEYEKGSSIILSEQAGHEIMFVADGSVDVKRSTIEGREVIVSRLGVGEVFGEIALLTDSKRSADVIAAEDCMLLLLPSTAFEELLLAQSSFMRALLVHLANRVAAASTRIADLALLDVSCRVYRTLLLLAKKNSQGELLVENRPTHKELSAMVGTSREMVTRVLKKLEDEGTISTEDRVVKIMGHFLES